MVFIGVDRVDPGLHVDLNDSAPAMYVGVSFANHSRSGGDWKQYVYSSDRRLFKFQHDSSGWKLVQLEHSGKLHSNELPEGDRYDRKAHPLALEGLFGREERLTQEGLWDIQRGAEVPSDLAERLKAIIARYVYLPEPEWQYDLLAAWIAGTYIYKVFNTYPFLMLTSTEPGCGKSRLLQVVERLAFNAEHPYGISESTLIRYSAASACTLLIDEQEMLGRQATLGRKIIELLNARYESTGNYMMSVPQGTRGWKPSAFRLFGPTAIAKLSEGGIPPAIESRSIKILMKPLPEGGTDDEQRDTRLRQLRHLHLDQDWSKLRDDLYLWAARNWWAVYQTYISTDQEFLTGLNRQLDLWRVLLSVARHLPTVPQEQEAPEQDAQEQEATEPTPSTYQVLLSRVLNAPPRVESEVAQIIRHHIEHLRETGEELVRVKDFARRLPESVPLHLRRGGQPLSRVLRGLKNELQVEVRVGSGNVNYIYL